MSASGQVVVVCDGYRKVYEPVKGLEWNDNYFLVKVEKAELTDEGSEEGRND